MPWQGISELIDAYGKMRVRVRASTAAGAVAAARVIYVGAKANILGRFIQHTGRLWESMTYDQRATPLGENVWGARAFPRGPRSLEGTVYGRIQELGGTIYPHNPTDKLWFNSIRQDGTYGVISVFDVTLEGRFYLRDSVITHLGEERGAIKGYWAAALK